MMRILSILKTIKNGKTGRIIRRSCEFLLSVAVIFYMYGCASMNTHQLPPITAEATNIHHEGKVVWYDLLTEDVAAANSFYSKLFGWTIRPSTPSSDYLVIYNNDKSIGGVTLHENTDPEALESLWLVTLSVRDVDNAMATTRRFQGKVLDGPFDVEGRGRMAIVEDPLGAPLILMRSSTGDPDDAAPVPGEWLWVDFFTRDLEKTKAFYAELVGYEFRELQVGEDHSHHFFYQGNKRPRAGLVVHTWEDIDANWLPYVMVEDINRVIKEAGSLGGKLIMRKSDVAILTDPSGAAFGVQSKK